MQAFDAIVVTKVIGHPGSFLFKEVRLLQLFGPPIIIIIITITTITTIVTIIIIIITITTITTIVTIIIIIIIIAITTIVVIITITTTRKNSGLSYYLNCTLRIR